MAKNIIKFCPLLVNIMCIVDLKQFSCQIQRYVKIMLLLSFAGQQFHSKGLANIFMVNLSLPVH